MVAASRAVLAPHAFDLIASEQAATMQPPVEQQVACHLGERPAQPFTGRRLESLLRPLEDGARHASLEHSPEQIFATVAPQLQRRRHRGGELEQTVVEERLTRFERHGHAHPVDLRQDVVEHVRLHVDVQRAIQRVWRTARIPCGAERGERIGAAQGALEVRRIQSGLPVGFEDVVRVLVRARVVRGQRKMADRAGAFDAARELPSDVSGDSADPRAEPAADARLPLFHAVARIARPQLVATVSG